MAKEKENKMCRKNFPAHYQYFIFLIGP